MIVNNHVNRVCVMQVSLDVIDKEPIRHIGYSHLPESKLTTRSGGWQALSTFGFGFLVSDDWNPVTDQFGALVPIYGTLVSSLIAQGSSAKPFGLTDGLDYLILAPILYFSPLLISFSVYFGFWHSLPSMLAEYAYLRNIPAFNSPLKFGKQLLPFSGISLVGIAGILFAGLEFLNPNQLYLLFFVLISLISLPHILYMDTFLKEKFQN